MSYLILFRTLNFIRVNCVSFLFFFSYCFFFVLYYVIFNSCRVVSVSCFNFILCCIYFISLFLFYTIFVMGPRPKYQAHFFRAYFQPKLNPIVACPNEEQAYQLKVDLLQQRTNRPSPGAPFPPARPVGLSCYFSSRAWSGSMHTGQSVPHMAQRFFFWLFLSHVSSCCKDHHSSYFTTH